MSTFTGFSEEDLKRIKSGDSSPNNEPATPPEINTNIKKITKIGLKTQTKPQYKITFNKQLSDEIDNLDFEKCRLSIKPTENINNNIDLEDNNNEEKSIINDVHDTSDNDYIKDENISNGSRKSSSESAPDLVKVAICTEDESGGKVKIEELQLKQKLMEEQNKRRKEMLAKALADRTKQTEEEVVRLEKIKKELQVLDGQFSQDVALLRKKIDVACLTYADAEKHYLKVEKEFLQAKLNLQKEKEKKELLTEHLCALITHNETRKAQKLETLMLQLVDERRKDGDETSDDEPMIVDGVDVKTGKIVEMM